MVSAPRTWHSGSRTSAAWASAKTWEGLAYCWRDGSDVMSVFVFLELGGQGFEVLLSAHCGHGGVGVRCAALHSCVFCWRGL